MLNQQDWRLRLRSLGALWVRQSRALRIIGLVIPENIASVRVLEKTGLRYAETVTFWGNQFSKYVINP
jgi:RimJ/RimL family protein N-acetyltransferase